MSNNVGHDTRIPADPNDLDGEAVRVDELNSTLNNIINNTELTKFDFLLGDVSDKSESDGTIFFRLVGNDCSIQCIIFQRHADTIPEFSSDDQVAVKGRLTFYEKQGECTIYVDDVIFLGDSERQRRIEQRKEQLQEEGLCDTDKEIPDFPETIGMVTSRGSDAEQDAVNAIHSRYPDVNIRVCDARVQGESAHRELCEAVLYYDAYVDVDVIVVTRGGGADESLDAFNQLGIARVIALSDTPVVTAIGHEEDTPIVDTVADSRAMTPTDVGDVIVQKKELIVDEYSTLASELDTSYEQYTENRIQEYETSLTTGYTEYCDTVVRSWEQQLETAHEKQQSSVITDYSNKLDATYEKYQQQKKHEKQQERIKERKRYLVIGVVGLGVLLLICIGIIMFLLL